MLFTSHEFIMFVAVIFILYYIIPKKCQWMILLLASYIFYFIAGPEYLIYIMATTITVYFSAIQIQKNIDRQKLYIKEHNGELSKEEKLNYKNLQKRIRSRWKVGCIVFNIGILAFAKYTNFLISNINILLNAVGKSDRLSFISIAVPLGISFYTFQSISYLIDVSRETVKAEKNIFKLALFVSFFPQLTQGPISRFGDLSKTLYGEHKFNIKNVTYGFQRVLWGFFKKLVVADRILVGVITIIGDYNKYNGIYAFAGMIFYTVQLYADFTGGIDITIGISEMFGVKVMENFNRPYFSKSLKEYWRRWHISMCNWFRDYIFYPVTSCKAMKKISKFSKAHFGNNIGKRIPIYISSYIVWVSTGLWHDASWNFIVWGIANFFVLMVSEELEPFYDRFHQYFNLRDKKWYKCFQIIRTFLLVCILNLFDCFESISDTIKMLISAFNPMNLSVLWNGSMLQIGLTVSDYCVLFIGVMIILIVSICQRKGSVRDKISLMPYPFRFCLWLTIFVVILLMGAYGVGYDESQFIYNRF